MHSSSDSTGFTDLAPEKRMVLIVLVALRTSIIVGHPYETEQDFRDMINLISEVDNLESKFLHIEKKLLQLKTTGKGQDVVRYQKMIGEKLAYLAENVQISDFRPADSYYEVYELLHKRLQDVGLEYDNLVSNDLEEFISKMNSQDINTIVFN